MPKDTFPSYIYGLTDPRTGDVRYIGKTRRQTRHSVRYRYRSHLVDAQQNPKLTHKTRWISQLLDLGLEPGVVVLDEVLCTPEELSALEISRIAEYRALGFDLTNTTDGGDGGRGRLSEGQKAIQVARLVAANTGRKRSEKARENMRRAQSLRDPEERKLSQKKASDAAKAKGISEAGRQRISESSRRPKSEETRARMRAAQRRRWVKNREDETDV